MKRNKQAYIDNIITLISYVRLDVWNILNNFKILFDITLRLSN